MIVFSERISVHQRQKIFWLLTVNLLVANWVGCAVKALSWLNAECLFLSHRKNAGAQFVAVEGFYNILIGSCGVACFDVLRLSPASEQDDMGLGNEMSIANPAAQFNAAYSRHLPIKDADVNASSLQEFLSSLAVVCGDCFMPPIGQRSLH